MKKQELMVMNASPAAISSTLTRSTILHWGPWTAGKDVVLLLTQSGKQRTIVVPTWVRQSVVGEPR